MRDYEDELNLKLTAPHGSPIYLRPDAVCGVRQESPGSVVFVFGSTTAVVVQETPEQVRDAMKALHATEDEPEPEVELTAEGLDS